MSDSDYGNVEVSKKYRREKSKYVENKQKKRKRSRSSEKDGNVKNAKDRKHKSENDEDDERRNYKSKDRKYRKETDSVKEKYSERRRKKEQSEEGSDSEKESRRYRSVESKTSESKQNKTGKKKYEDKIEDSKERKRDILHKGSEKTHKNSSKYKENEEKRNKKEYSRTDESDGELKKKKISSNYEKSDKERSKKYSSRHDKSWDDDENQLQSHKYDMSDGDYKERNHDNSDGHEEDHRSSQEKPQRYWSNPRPMRENCDIYWNKFSDRFKETTDKMEVGPRYYSMGEKSKRGGRDREEEKDGKKDVGGGESEIKEKDVQNGTKEDVKNTAPKRSKTFDVLTSRTGGAYIPPAKLKMMQESITDKGSVAYQRLAWEALKKSIQGHVNKVNVSNILGVIKAVQKENIVRGKGLLCRVLIQAQAASPTFTNVYAALVSALNAKFPKIGELLLKRLVVQFRRGFKRNDKTICITAATFIAHLVNQEVAHEILALEILTLLIETPTDDSVEVAIAFLKECGMKLTEVANKGIMGIFDMLRNILHEGKLEKRVQYMIEVMFQIRKEDFKAHPSLIDDLDLVDQEDRITHLISLEDNHDPEDILNVFKFDPDYEANEAKYKASVEDSDDEGSDGEGGDSDGSDDDSEEEEDGGEEGEKQGVIVDKTETNLVALRKTIYLTIQSSLDFEECAHKLLKMELKPGQEIEMAHMFLDCCAEQRTYEKFFGLLSQRFCQINRSYIAPFEETFRDSYATIHRMSNDKLRNIAKLFAHLLYTDAISWDVLATIRLNEDDTTSSSRIFIKILFQELSEYMGLANLNQRVKDPALQSALEGLFPRDNPKHTRFAINFFTSIGLGGITDELREHLKSMPKPTLAVPQLVENLSSSSDSSSSDSSSSSSDSSSDSSSSSESSSDSEDSSRKKKNKGKSISKKKKVSSPKKVEKTKSTSKRNSQSVPKKKKDR